MPKTVAAVDDHPQTRFVHYGHILFGWSAVLFGVIALMWHDADTWQSLVKFLSSSAGTIAGEFLMIAQIIGGVGLAFARTRRPASIVLAIVFAIFCLACIPGIVASPKVFGEYDGFFEQFSLLCGALAAYVGTVRDTTRSAALGRTARLGFGISTMSFTLAQAVYFHETALLVPRWIPPTQTFWAILTTVAFGLAAFAIIAGQRAGLALRLLTLMVALFGVLVWIPLLIAHPQSHGNWSEFALTSLIAGAAWVTGDLPPSALSSS